MRCIRGICILAPGANVSANLISTFSGIIELILNFHWSGAVRFIQGVPKKRSPTSNFDISKMT